MILLAGLVQMSGSGLSFQCDAQVSIGSLRSATEVKLASRSVLRVRAENQPSISFNDDAEVGVK